VPTPVAAPAFSDEPATEVEPAEAAVAAPEAEAAPEIEDAPVAAASSAPAATENEVPKVRYVSSSGYGRVTVGSTKAPKTAKASAAPAAQIKLASTKSYQEAAAQLPSKRGRPKAESPAPPNSRSRNAAPEAEAPALAEPSANVMTLAGTEEGNSQVVSRAAELFGDSMEVKVGEREIGTFLIFVETTFHQCHCSWICHLMSFFNLS
jgi:hypothetical protein